MLETAESPTKPELRERLREAVSSIEPTVAATAADRVAERVLTLPEIASARRILTCLSFGSEIDTWKLSEHLLASGHELFVPRADPRDGKLHVHPYPCPLRTLAFGLKQPPRGAPEVEERSIDSTLDAVLVLGLGYDRRGFRLGYGSGYFDRFLRDRPFPSVGLGYDVQLLDRLPDEAHDVPMTVVVTDREEWRPVGST